VLGYWMGGQTAGFQFAAVTRDDSLGRCA
jgi:hypothetical protein